MTSLKTHDALGSEPQGMLCDYRNDVYVLLTATANSCLFICASADKTTNHKERRKKDKMKIQGTLMALVAAVVAVGVYGGKTSLINSDVQEAFSSPAAEQSYEAQGDMSRNLTDAQIVASIKKGAVAENYARSFSCSTGCSVNCSRSCSSCCSHQCGRGY